MFDWLINKSFTFIDYIKELKQNPVELPSPQLVAKRFRQLFIDHGIEETRIPRVFPKITLDDLSSDHLLIKKLTPELINEVAELFKVRSDWLEGEDERIYPYRSCYKQPQDFFDLFNSIKHEIFNYPVRLVTSAEKLDFRADGYQPILIMIAEKIAVIGEKDIYRYYIDTEWSWSHSPCRLQLKAIGYQIYKKLRLPIPIFKVDHSVFERIALGECIPTHYVNSGFATDPSLEDFLFYPHESPISKEHEDIAYVIDYIKEYKLNNCLNTELQDVPVSQAIESAKEKLSPQEKAKKAASVKNKAANEIKLNFVNAYVKRVKAKSISQAKAAQTFYDNLTAEEERFLARSPKDYEKSTNDEVRSNGIRTLQTAMRNYLKQNPN